jgi:hypothetical protein
MNATEPEVFNPTAQALRAIWPNLPVLLVSGSAVSAAAILVSLFTPGITPLSCVLWCLIVGPCFGALQAQFTDLALGSHVKVFSFPRYLRRFGLLGLGTWAPPAIIAAVGLIALQWWNHEQNAIVLIPLVIIGAGLSLSVLGAIAALPVGISNNEERGVPLFIFALHIVARRPVPVIAVVAVAALGFWAATTISASMLLLVSVPLAVTAYAATWTSAAVAGLAPKETGLLAAV